MGTNRDDILRRGLIRKVVAILAFGTLLACGARAADALAEEGRTTNKESSGVMVEGTERQLIDLSPGRLFPGGLPEHEWVTFEAAGYDVPVTGVVYRRGSFLWSGMPLGGLATGCLDIEADGRLGYNSIFKPVWGCDGGVDGGRHWRDVVYARNQDRASVLVNDPSRGKLDVAFLGLAVDGQATVLTTQVLNDVQTVSYIDYWGHYPVVDFEFPLDGPVGVGLRAWSPFIPGDIERSSVPGAIFEVHLRNATDSVHKGTIAFCFPGPRPREAEGKPFVRESVHTDELEGVFIRTADNVGYVLAAMQKNNIRTGGGGLANHGLYWSYIDRALPRATDGDGGATIAVDFVLQPRETRAIRYVLAWYSPKWLADWGPNCPQWFTHMYTARFEDARDVAEYLAENHESLLAAILNWQTEVYAEKDLPGWLQDGLINTLHLIAENAFWARLTGPLAEWRDPDGLFSLVESSVAAGQQSCIPCDWYGNLPLVYFFPELARNTLRAYTHFMRDDGAVPFVFGTGLDLLGDNQHDRQRTLNGCCFVDLVDRLWLSSGNDAYLEEFYPAVKKSVTYMMNLVPGTHGVISTAGDQWYECMAWPGMSSHVGGVRLATLRMAERMAEKTGDTAFAEQCRTWFKQGQDTLDRYLWGGDHYYLYNDESGSGAKSDVLLSHVLDGEWMADLHGLPAVFPKDRIDKTLATIKRVNAPLTTAGLLVVADPAGGVSSIGGRMGGVGTMPASTFITACNFIYEGDVEGGLDIARDCLHEVVCEQGMTWDMPNVFIGTHNEKRRVYGTDYYQCMSLWALPAALRRADISASVQGSSVIRKIVEAGSRR